MSEQDKAQARRDVAKKEAQAEASRAAESTAKARQRRPKGLKTLAGRTDVAASQYGSALSALPSNLRGRPLESEVFAQGVPGVRAAVSATALQEGHDMIDERR